MRIIQATADEITSRHGDAANRYWRNTIANLRTRMIDAGACRVEVERELSAFADSVFT